MWIVQRFGRVAFDLRVSSHEGGPRCRYEVLYGQNGLQADPNINWEVIGYRSLAEFKADRESDFKSKPVHRLSCYLTRRE